MKLLTKEIIKALEKAPLHTTDGLGDQAPVVVKFFGGGRYSFFVTEGEPYEDGDWYLYGYCVSPLGPMYDEWGPALLSEIAQLKFRPFGLPVERDYAVTPGKFTVAELKERSAA